MELTFLLFIPFILLIKIIHYTTYSINFMFGRFFETFWYRLFLFDDFAQKKASIFNYLFVYVLVNK